MKQSTRAFFKLHGWRNFIDFIHGYIYSRWINTYLRVITGRMFIKKKRSGPAPSGPRPVVPQHPIGKWFQERYHSKVLTHEDAGKIVRLDRPLRVENPDQVIPYEIANSIILDTPGSMAVMRCPCREIKDNGSCGPLEVCMVVGEPFVDFVVDHKVNGARRISREEGLQILDDTRDRGWVHTAWFKDAMAGRFYAICNCCSCCCIPMRAMNRTGHEAKYVSHSGYVAELDRDSCSGCGGCDDICPFGAMSDPTSDGGGYVSIDRDKCFGCGVCANLCSNGAVFMVEAPDKGLPMDVERLASA